MSAECSRESSSQLLTGFSLGAGGSTCAAGEEIGSRREEPTSVVGEGDLSPESPPTPPSASQRCSIFRSSLARTLKFQMESSSMDHILSFFQRASSRSYHYIDSQDIVDSSILFQK
ncbi:hypothetical protein TNCT_21401 [Trichonephila clavata]|uniref:Uncharacterized protein n=1 Tax=Trichonephila clavata TaxID=2740835 RepID=A0A8X6EWQ2_TRICU|nr:hypothetical protein TNCT_21401 [Trichonephila clavata]